MRQCEKLEVLNKIVEALEIGFDDLKIWFEERKNQIPVKLDIVYEVTHPCGRCFEVLPYIDQRRIKEVWGVAIGNIGFYRRNEPDRVNWYRAMEIAQTRHAGLPDYKDQEELFLKKNIFNEVMQTFRNCGISADDWLEQLYWSCDQGNRDSVVAHQFDMRSECSGNLVYSKESGCAYVRAAVRLR